MGKKQKHKPVGSSSSIGIGGDDGLDSSSIHTNTRRTNVSGSKAADMDSSQSSQLQVARQASRLAFLGPLEKWFHAERAGIMWVFGCVAMGCLFGFGIGSGWLTGATAASGVAPWRVELGSRIRSSIWYQLFFVWDPDLLSDDFPLLEDEDYLYRHGPLHPSHPRVFAVLREAVMREKRGYVHPDLGLLVPAPSGASRGLGMVRDSYHQCQIQCFPGVAVEKAALREQQVEKLKENPGNATMWLPPIPNKPVYRQEEILVRVPLGFQMTRQVALDTIMARLPGDVQRKTSPNELDDAALLVLLLAHERGVGRHSRWLPYIASLPKVPSCGYSPKLRPYILDSMNALSEELGVDTYGWQAELVKAQKHATKISQGLAKDYGAYIKTPEGMTAAENIEWALCQVTSRATAGSEEYGALRLVPLIDMINHYASAGGFVELTGKERLDESDFIQATEDDAGTFVVRSLRHGRRKALRKGQELLVNYNVPHYSPLDWFVSLGFVPPERQTKWQKIDAALPRVRQDLYGVMVDEEGSPSGVPSAQLWDEKYGPTLLSQYKQLQKQKKNQNTPGAAATRHTEL